LLVAVGGRGVDAAVARLQSRRHGRLGLCVRDLPDAEPQLGHLDAVVQDDRGDLAHELSILRLRTMTNSPILNDHRSSCIPARAIHAWYKASTSSVYAFSMALPF